MHIVLIVHVNLTTCCSRVAYYLTCISC